MAPAEGPTDPWRRTGRSDLWPYSVFAAGATLSFQAKERAPMRATVGDRISIRGHRVGEAERDCEVLDVRGPDGAPPYLVRWGDTGHESLFFPGSDASAEHFEHGQAVDPR